jgi:hypothetical protein
MKNPVFTVLEVKCLECIGLVFNVKYSSEQYKMLMCSCEDLPPTLKVKL